MTDVNTVYDPTLDMWPDLRMGRIVLSPVRIGMDRYTGKMLTGWNHVVQSMLLIFSTRYHERVLRRWCGSFVPHLIGENATDNTIARFYWAIATGIDLWEPNYRIRRVYFMGDALSGWAPLPTMSAAELIRIGQAIFRNEGVYRPRGHLGDFSPWEQKLSAIIGRGDNLWDVKAAP
jgi:phage baseplate assembly protein W